jgi:hypothetical protein
MSMLSRQHVVWFAAAAAIAIPGQALPAEPEHHEGDEQLEPYGVKGEWELGGSASLAWTSDVTTLTLGPSLGYFFKDNWEVTGTFDLVLTHANGDTTTRAVIAVEPSYHIPFRDRLFAFAGLGVGIGFDGGTDFELAPRVGVNYQIGRSGIITPALKVPIIFDGGTNVGLNLEIEVSTVW